MSKQQLLTVVELKDPEVLFPKNHHMEAISVAVRTGTFPFFSSPHILSLSLSLSLSTPLWDALPPQYNLGADKGSGATEQVSHYNVLGERES